MTTHNCCPVCAEKILRGCIGLGVRVANAQGSFSGVLTGFHINGRILKVIIREASEFHAVDNVVSLITFVGGKRLEISHD